MNASDIGFVGGLLFLPTPDGKHAFVCSVTRKSSESFQNVKE